MKRILFFGSICFFLFSCKKNDTPAAEPRLIFKFKFDSTQIRLNNTGDPSFVPAGNAAQSPVFHSMSAHYIEIAQEALTPFGSLSNVLYKNAEVTTGGSNAIDFSKSIIKAEGEEFFSVPLKNLKPDTYKWLRISLAYQNYDIKMTYRTPSYNSGNPFEINGTVASFLGFNTYVTSYDLNGETMVVNANRKQGYGAVKPFNIPVLGTINAVSWNPPATGRTTVVNPYAVALGIPAGSCLVVAQFSNPIVITGSEIKDIVVTVSLSINKSFEWVDKNQDGLFEPIDGLNGNAIMDSVVDMGIRGMIPIVN